MNINTIEELLSLFPRYTMEATPEGGVLHIEDKQGEWIHHEEIRSVLEKMLESFPEIEENP